LGLDGSTYHLAAVANWVMDGSTGHSQDLYARIPVGSYPLTAETAIAWAVGLAHSFAPLALWTASVAVLLASAAWVGLRALVVALGAVATRGSLRRLAVALALAAALGCAAGGLWYLRNLLAHGSPLWPFLAAPWGDSVPPLFARVNHSLLERPRATLEGQWALYRVTL